MSRPVLGTAERAAADRVLASGMLTQGDEVAALEAEFAATMSGRECVAVASGTAALHIGLSSAGIGPGDEVIVPAFTFAATANAVIHAGATPVFADIDPATFCLDPAAADSAVTARTAAIIPVHLYGHPADMDSINQLGRRHGLLVLEDACQAQGATHRENPAGALADLGAVSFYPTKTMTTGEGGMLVCGDSKTADVARVLRNQGFGPRQQALAIGYNARMTDLAAAIGRVQLGRVPEFLAQRRANAARWDAALPAALLPYRAAYVESAQQQYTLRCPDRSAIVAAFAAAGVETRVYYDSALHRTDPFRRANTHSLPVAEAAARHVLSIPVGPHLSAAQTDRVEQVLANL
ncbi:MAG: DegT/DnrJ/EryC1/StrS family aminotransferase [Pseudonocardiales bacterium]